MGLCPPLLLSVVIPQPSKVPLRTLCVLCLLLPLLPPKRTVFLVHAVGVFLKTHLEQARICQTLKESAKPHQCSPQG